MAEERSQRRLAAIMAADVVGYSRLIEQNEASTLAALKERRRTILAPLVAHHHGRIVKVMGDGVLVEFGSAVNAVACAVELQHRMAEANDGLPEDRKVVLRIGINLGDVVVDGGDLYGDGVNVANRLQGIAGPGDICVAGSVYDQVKRKLDFGFDELGLQTVKNIAEPVLVYRVWSSSSTMQDYYGQAEKAALPLPGKPSIAVLPFTNMSNDTEQETFVDGLTEDLITDLSRTSGLFVIASNSVFAYKGRHVDVRRIARELGVRYLLEGSARRAAGRVRINAQLIDAIGGDHLWAERFDRSLEDIFAVQDEVTGKIVEALVGRLTTPPARSRPTNLEAYELCVRARALGLQTALVAREAIFLLERAIALDPEYAEAYRWLALNLWCGWEFWDEPMDPNRARAEAEAQRAVALDPNDAGNRWVLGTILGHERRWAESDAEFDATLRLDPNCADAWAMRSDLITLNGRPADAVEYVRKALRLNPHPPGWYYWMLGQAQYALRDYESAVQTLLRPETYRTTSRRLLAASLAQLGRMEEARQEAEMFMISNPNFTIRHWSASQPIRDEDVRQHFVDGYRMAGLPE
ncbi:guanylyl cyclase [Sinorhizobium fredii USDA 205]|uniref:Tetratricopeptide repeat protein n=1 Tax=Rhizobium fredii TaxID=380 RepID=A0A844AHC9_RHIFR|nr:adenylate/guanylate cyclase domain-containing protein [Sinorhizobium fredii]ASY71903.1 Adenylate cyclase [Sinorhizobium fredii CCBAU 83666]KSV82903.1 guanylyl cyclase [Sinorhizobium fredii USDA 205]MQW94689.1 tetratricopeptide repeat protein [Sinorhizobium fredii]MQX11358.1 tetratricopeptide repeat protein [Sinorhizobium fredii]UTY46740.1 adenylate/guanylate cyclase domain-containing protein [Sinorhizobium fredii]